MLTDKQRRTLRALAAADGASFTELVEIARLDPARAFRGADLRDVDFGNGDLSGYDFTEADLSGANLERARIRGAIFERCRSSGTRWPLQRREMEAEPSRYELTDMQFRAIDKMLGDLIPAGRSLVLMPAGTGRNRVLEEVIRHLLNERPRSILLLVNTIAEREQFAALLRRPLAPRAVATSRLVDGGMVENGVTIWNANYRDLAQLEGQDFLRLLGRFDAIFTTSLEKIAQLARAGLEKIAGKILLGAIDSMPIDADRPDQRQFISRMHRFFGEPSFICGLDEAIRTGLLQPVQIERIEGYLPYSEIFGRGRLSRDDYHHWLKPIAEEITRLFTQREMNDLLVITHDDQQLSALHILLRVSSNFRVGRLVRAGVRWNERRKLEPFDQRPGIILAPISRQSMEAARRQENVALLTPLSVARAQELAYRPRDGVTDRAIIFDFANAFSGFPDIHDGERPVLDDGPAL